MDEELLDKFGESLVIYVRDWSIKEIDGIVNGTLSKKQFPKMKEIISNLSCDQKSAIKKFIPIIVDTTIHYFLWLIVKELFVIIIIGFFILRRIGEMYS